MKPDPACPPLPRREPELRVGVVDGQAGPAAFALEGGPFRDPEGRTWSPGDYVAMPAAGGIELQDPAGRRLWAGPLALLAPREPASCRFLLKEVPIGIGFHWQQRRDQRFPGVLELSARPGGTLVAVNRVSLEDYLECVVAAEMSPAAPPAFLEAHAVVSRSWLVAQLGRRGRPAPPRAGIRWYDREDHDLYDVCADDHCQRYQGVAAAAGAGPAVRATRGLFLVASGRVVDARFAKACGGVTEEFATAWEEDRPPGLGSVRCWHPGPAPDLTGEAQAGAWIRSRPPAWCADPPPAVRAAILPDFDQATRDFFRWSVTYGRDELEERIRAKGGPDVGTLLALQAVRRGPSGRIRELRLEGSRGEAVVGKELEIRRLLAPTHLYSSAFVVQPEGGTGGTPARFVLHGAGWGHGVGLCQIGAAVMALAGHGAGEILRHYYPGAGVERLYGS